MKKRTGNTIALGIFVSAGIALFIFGIYRIGTRQQLFGNSFRISCMFSDVNGLQPGNNVRFAGITVGTVEDVQLENDSSVRVDLRIDYSAKKFIKKNAIAGIGSEGLMGNKLLVISPGDGTAGEIENNDFIASSYPITMDDIMYRLNVSTENAAYITEDVRAITESIREGKGAIGKLFMDSLMAKNLNQSILNIREGSRGFKSNMDAAKKSFLLRSFFKKNPEKKESGK